MDDVDGKKDLMTKRLDRLQEQRQAKIEKQRQDKEDDVVIQDTVTVFTSQFQQEKEIIDQKLEECQSLDSKQLPDQFDSIAIAMENLEKFVADSSLFLPGFVMRQAQESLKKLRNNIDSGRDQYLPKKKFTFKSRKKVQSNKATPSSSTTTTTDDRQDKTAQQDVVDTNALARRLCDYSNLQDQIVDITADEIASKDVKLSHLIRCTVRISGYPSALQMDHLKQCTILSGPISSSVFVDQCYDCKIVVACQQLRVHSSTDIQFYIGVTSRAIIEDCTRFFFSPYNWSYQDIDQHFTLAALDKSKLNWSAIDDFNWLRIDQPSPNWSVLSEQDRVNDWDR